MTALRGTSAATRPYQPCRVRVRLVIPQRFYQEPVLSRLVSEYGLTFSVITAHLAPNTDGHFDLHVWGRAAQISAGLAYLDALGVAIASRPNPDGDGWFC